MAAPPARGGGHAPAVMSKQAAAKAKRELLLQAALEVVDGKADLRDSIDNHSSPSDLLSLLFTWAKAERDAGNV